jgi:N-acetylglucosamine kinase-like BadF-type ATPase
MAVIGVDGGNTKTDLLVATLEGEPLAYVRGRGSNSHGLGAEGCVDVIAELFARAGLDGRAEHAAFFLCGADGQSDVDELAAELAKRGWARGITVDNDTFALLWTGTDADDAVAVVCGAGINCVGRSADGRTSRLPALGWETGDWGGADIVGREALFLAARAEDGRGEPTALVEAVRGHFGLPTAAAVGDAVHYRHLRITRLGELAPAVLAAAERGDDVARSLVQRLAEEVALLARRALADLGLLERPADVVLGGGMLRRRKGLLHDEVLARLRARAPHARPVVAVDPPVIGAALAALDAVGAPPEAGSRLRAALPAPEDLRG